MDKYFNINLEFDHKVFFEKIDDMIRSKGKGYICVVDANVITIAQKDLKYREILNLSSVNTCDGSSIALLAGKIHKQKFRALNGPEIFQKYIEKDYKQLLLGSTEEISENVKKTLESKNINSDHILALALPFKSVEDFDYKAIAEKIEQINPEIIWVSLGAPKQEIFMSKLLPYIKSGVMFGIGAAFNFYNGDLNLPDFRIGALKFIWLNRLFQEPKKIFGRLKDYVLIIPKLYFDEKKLIKNK